MCLDVNLHAVHGSLTDRRVSGVVGIPAMPVADSAQILQGTFVIVTKSVVCISKCRYLRWSRVQVKR
jgi:hypothetical protein